MLGSHDSEMGMHIHDVYNQLPSCIEACMVTLSRHAGSKARGFFLEKSFWYFLYRKIFGFVGMFRIFLKTGIYVDRKTWNDAACSEYAYFDNEFIPCSANAILSKCPKGFTPDYISIHFCSKFINSSVIRDLQKRTGATIIIIMLDQAPLTGGCHYTCDCTEYKTGCVNCPVIKGCVSNSQWNNKLNKLRDLPKIISGVPSDIRMAQSVEFFKNSTFTTEVYNPNVEVFEKQACRDFFKIEHEYFYILIGSNFAKRKGLKYAIEAIKMLTQIRTDFCVLIAGHHNDNLDQELKNINHLFLGYLDISNLLKAFASADCYISPSLADSGPMMVNYSMKEGTPVVSFNVGIAQDLVLHEKTGYIAEYANSRSICTGIEFIMGLPLDQRAVMSSYCKQMLEQKSKESCNWIQYIIKDLK